MPGNIQSEYSAPNLARHRIAAQRVSAQLGRLGGAAVGKLVS